MPWASKESKQSAKLSAPFQLGTTTQSFSIILNTYIIAYSLFNMRHIFSKKNRALLSELVRTDFKLRYQGSVLGYAWSLLRPLLLFLVLYIVFVKFLKLGKGIP